MEFKKGDLVKIVGNDRSNKYGNHNFEIGDTCEVIEEYDKDYIRIVKDGLSQLVYKKDIVRITKTESAPAIKNIYVNESKRAVAVKFCDGDVRVIHCCEDDTFDVYVGVALAVAKKVYGSSEKFHTLVNKKIKKGNK